MDFLAWAQCACVVRKENQKVTLGVAKKQCDMETMLEGKEVATVREEEQLALLRSMSSAASMLARTAAVRHFQDLICHRKPVVLSDELHLNLRSLLAACLRATDENPPELQLLAARALTSMMLKDDDLWIDEAVQKDAPLILLRLAWHTNFTQTRDLAIWALAVIVQNGGEDICVGLCAEGFIPILNQVILQHFEDEETADENMLYIAVKALAIICKGPLAQLGEVLETMPKMVELVNDWTRQVAEEAAWYFANLLIPRPPALAEPATAAVLGSGVVDHMVKVIADGSPKSQLLVRGALKTLAGLIGNVEAEVLIDAGAIGACTALIRRDCEERNRKIAMRLLRWTAHFRLGALLAEDGLTKTGSEEEVKTQKEASWTLCDAVVRSATNRAHRFRLISSGVVTALGLTMQDAEKSDSDFLTVALLPAFQALLDDVPVSNRRLMLCLLVSVSVPETVERLRHHDNPSVRILAQNLHEAIGRLRDECSEPVSTNLPLTLYTDNHPYPPHYPPR